MNSAFTGMSSDAVRRHLRELASRRVLEGLTPTRNGFSFILCELEQIPGLPSSTTFEIELTVDDIDFFDRERVPALLERQQGRCLYSRAELNAETAELDHVIPQVAGGSNSHQNIVLCTFEMNKAKGSKEAAAFLRGCFRRGFLSEAEFEEQLALLKAIVDGENRLDSEEMPFPAVPRHSGASRSDEPGTQGQTMCWWRLGSGSRFARPE